MMAKGFLCDITISQPTLKELTPGSCGCGELMRAGPSQNIFSIRF
jgi:hypothetical protein